MDNIKYPRDLPQSLFSIIIILSLLCCSLWLLQPFTLSVIWAGLIVIATWPLFTLVRRKFNGNKTAAIALMMAFLIVIFLIPVIFSAGMLSLCMEKALSWVIHLDRNHFPTFNFLLKLPYFGRSLHDKWQQFETVHADDFLKTLQPWIVRIALSVAKELSQFGLLFINGIMMLLACLVFYLHGQTISRGLRLFAYRIARERGDLAIILAGKTVQAVAMGVVMTAVIQSIVAGLGLFVCQIPSCAMLTGIIFMLCLIQLGPVIIMLPAAIWLFYSGHHWSGSLLLIWSFIAGSLDNILKPLLIKRGADTSLLLIMAGVIGGMLTWGMIGLMIGPVLLAVSWKLLSSWVNDVSYSEKTIKEPI